MKSFMENSEENQLNDLQKAIDHCIYTYLVARVSFVAIFLCYRVCVVYCVIAVLLLAFITAVC